MLILQDILHTLWTVLDLHVGATGRKIVSLKISLGDPIETCITLFECTCVGGNINGDWSVDDFNK